VDHHEHTSGVKGGRLLAATLLNLLISIAEIVGGIFSNSLSLISDALHNFSDALATFIAWIANRISKRPSNTKRTFGYKRIEILAAFINAMILVVISFYLFYEAILRLIEPQEVKGTLMLIVAAIGLFANLVAVLLLRGDAGKNINVKAAYLHLLGDTMTSVAVILGSVLIIFFEVYWIDPVITIIIGLYILKESWAILKQTNDILMQGTPEGLDLERICGDLEQFPEISNIHHVHIWNLDDHSIHFECHVELNKDLRLSETEAIHKKVEQFLQDKYHIGHITIQFEFERCQDHSLVRT
jgi:cobalt-zinc-cadmium efflux system protein